MYDLYEKEQELEHFFRRMLGELYIRTQDNLDFYRLSSPKEKYEYISLTQPELIKRVSVAHISSYIGVAK